MKKLYLLVLLLLLIPSQSWADTHAAASCSQAHVQAAVDASTAGDIVTVPGSCNPTWSSPVSVTKGIEIIGGGRTSTIINGSSSVLFNIVLGSGRARISEFGFTGSGGTNGGNTLNTALIRIAGTGKAENSATIFDYVRIDHCTFTNITGANVIAVAEWWDIPAIPKIVIDNITYTNSQSTSGYNFIKVMGAQIAWAQPDYYGTDKAIYIEDSTISFTGGVTGCLSDSENGARWVIRHNTFSNLTIQSHDSHTLIRGHRFSEVYNNTIACTAAECSNMAAVALRGGSGVYYNNTITGNYFSPFYYQNSRSEGSDINGGKLGYTCGSWTGHVGHGKVCTDSMYGIYWRCSGSKDRCSDSSDYCGSGQTCVINCSTNSDCRSGESCVYIDGESFSDGAPCRDASGMGQDNVTTGVQARSPMYLWSNTFNGATAGGSAHGGYPNGWREGYEYCNHSPATACGTVSGWTYTAYTFPHPLRGDVPPGVPPVISNLAVTGAINGVLTCTEDPRWTEITLTTDKTATCKGSPTDEAYADMDWTFDDTNSTYHVKSLQRPCDTTNTYYIRCTAGGYPNLSSSIISYVISPTGGDSTPPTWNTATVAADGRTLTLAFDEAVKFGAGGNSGVTVTPSGGAATATYASGANSLSLVYMLSRTILSTETLTTTYTQPGSGIEDTSNNDLVTVSGKATTNNSTQTAIVGTARSIWAADVDMSSTVDIDFGGAIEVGVKFQTSVAAVLTGIKFYKQVNNTGTHTGNIWTYPAGVNLGTVEFTGETASGWQTMTFATPMHLAANTTYIASVFMPTGLGSGQAQYFANQVSNPPLSAIQCVPDDTLNGVYKYSAVTTFPTAGSYSCRNYWVDVVLEERKKLTIEIGTGPMTITIGGGNVTLSW